MSVLVLGMHRSGTSVATRMASLLGPSICRSDDLVHDRNGNERGVWESATLVRYNDKLLTAAGAAWWRPPPLDYDWSTAALTRADEAQRAFRLVHPAPSWIWKDPRNCLTVEFWLKALAVRPVVLVALRDPLEICGSLTARNQFSAAAGLALWERYLRGVLRGVAGLPVFVFRYDDLLADPSSWMATVARLFADAGIPADLDAGLRASTYIAADLRHAGRGTSTQSPWSDEHRRLAARLDDLVGVHHRFPAVELGPVSSATEDFFATQRAAATTRYLFAPRQARATEPATSIVVISRNEGRALRDTVEQLRVTTPRTSEIIVVDDQSDDHSAERLDDLDAVRVIRPPQRLGIAQARNLGASAASGRILVFSDAHVHACPSWLPALSTALDDPDIGAAAPRLAGFRDDHTVDGLTFVDETLNVRWLHRPGETAPFPVPLLAGCFLAMRREVFAALGGFDSGMTGYGAEDLELCLRLWRTGFRCVTVPDSLVRHRFRRPTDHGIDHVGFLHNVLRLATLHLAPPRLAAVVAALRGQPEFASAAALLLAGDIAAHRARMRALCWVDEDAFLRRFGPSGLVGESERATDSRQLVEAR